MSDENTKIEDVVKTPLEQLSYIEFKTGVIDVVFEEGLDYDLQYRRFNSMTYEFNYFVLEEEFKDIYSFINQYTFKNVFSNRTYIYLYKNSPIELSGAINISVDLDDLEILNIINSVRGLKLFSNYNNINNVSVKTSTFFDHNGSNCFMGGAERYLIDLHNLLKSKGLNLDVYQIATRPFFRKFFGMNVIGLYLGKDISIDNSYIYADINTKNYIYRTYNSTLLHIYSSFQECYPNHIGPSIGISHGISWDHKLNNYSYGSNYFWENKKKYIDAAYFCNTVISVDTNTPNWFQTVDYELGNNKIHTIVNYVDTENYQYVKKSFSDKKIIVFPRRLCEPKGINLVLEIIDDILSKYPNVEFHFVGRGSDDSILFKIDELKSKYGNSIKQYYNSPDKMSDVYKTADISLIPTLYSEGTSLSCLESMASGNIVIATRVGGLTDLVIDGYNGFLIEPNSLDLLKTLTYVLDNFDELKKLRENAVNVAKAFNKDLWKKKWLGQFKNFDLNKKSDTNDLMEIYLNEIEDLDIEIREIIRQHLLVGDLVYVRLKNLPELDNISSGLLQVLSFDEEIVSKANKVYAKKEFRNVIHRDEEIVYI